MAERAEQDDLVVILFLLLIDHLANAVELRVILRKQICELQHMMCKCHQCRCRLAVKIIFVQVHIRVFHHLVKPAGNQIPNMRCESKDATRCLTADRAHHKRN